MNRKFLIWMLLILVVLSLTLAACDGTGGTGVTSYTITFESNGGSEVEPLVVVVGQDIVVPTDPTRDGYEFAGWYLDMDLSQSFSIDTVLDNNITVYASWTEIVIPSYTVTFDSNDGSQVQALTIISGECAIAPADPTKDGYEFAGWYTDVELTQIFDFDTAIDADITLYADWTVVILDTYTVQFDTNGGSSVDDITAICGDSISQPTEPTLEGYIFAGWYCDAEFSMLYDFSEGVVQDITLYAMWSEEVIVYQVEFIADDVTVDTVQFTSTQDTIQEPAVPEKEGYTGAWEEYQLTYSDVVVYAVYTQNIYTVTLRGFDNSIVAEYEVGYGESVDLPKGPYQEGYIFYYWRDGLTDSFVDTSCVTSNIVGIAEYLARGSEENSIEILDQVTADYLFIIYSTVSLDVSDPDSVFEIYEDYETKLDGLVIVSLGDNTYSLGIEGEYTPGVAYSLYLKQDASTFVNSDISELSYVYFTIYSEEVWAEVEENEDVDIKVLDFDEVSFEYQLVDNIYEINEIEVTGGDYAIGDILQIEDDEGDYLLLQVTNVVVHSSGTTLTVDAASFDVIYSNLYINAYIPNIDLDDVVLNENLEEEILATATVSNMLQVLTYINSSDLTASGTSSASSMASVSASAKVSGLSISKDGSIAVVVTITIKNALPDTFDNRNIVMVSDLKFKTSVSTSGSLKSFTVVMETVTENNMSVLFGNGASSTSTEITNFIKQFVTLANTMSFDSIKNNCDDYADIFSASFTCFGAVGLEFAFGIYYDWGVYANLTLEYTEIYTSTTTLKAGTESSMSMTTSTNRSFSDVQLYGAGKVEAEAGVFIDIGIELFYFFSAGVEGRLGVQISAGVFSSLGEELLSSEDDTTIGTLSVSGVASINLYIKAFKWKTTYPVATVKFTVLSYGDDNFVYDVDWFGNEYDIVLEVQSDSAFNSSTVAELLDCSDITLSTFDFSDFKASSSTGSFNNFTIVFEEDSALYYSNGYIYFSEDAGYVDEIITFYYNQESDIAFWADYANFTFTIQIIWSPIPEFVEEEVVFDKISYDSDSSSYTEFVLYSYENNIASIEFGDDAMQQYAAIIDGSQNQKASYIRIDNAYLAGIALGEYTIDVVLDYGETFELVLTVSDTRQPYLVETSGFVDISTGDSAVIEAVTYSYYITNVQLAGQDINYDIVEQFESATVTLDNSLLEQIGYGTANIVIHVDNGMSYTYSLVIDDSRAPILIKDVLFYDKTYDGEFIVALEMYNCDFVTLSATNIYSNEYRFEDGILYINTSYLKSLLSAEYTFEFGYSNYTTALSYIDLDITINDERTPILDSEEYEYDKQYNLSIIIAGMLYDYTTVVIEGNGIDSDDFYVNSYYNEGSIVIDSTYFDGLDYGEYKYLISFTNDDDTVQKEITVFVVDGRNATVTESMVSIFEPSDVVYEIQMYDNNFVELKLDGSALSLGDDFTFEDGKLTVLKSVVDELDVGSYKLSFVTDTNSVSLYIYLYDADSVYIAQTTKVYDGDAFEVELCNCAVDYTVEYSVYGTDDYTSEAPTNAGSYSVKVDVGYIVIYGTIHITPKTLYVGQLDEYTKPYDTTTDNNQGYDLLYFDGVVDSDVIYLVAISNGYNSKDVFYAQYISFTNIQIFGLDRDNYVLDSTSYLAYASITAKEVELIFYIEDKTYDTTTSATISGFGINGLLDGSHIIQYTNAVAVFDDKNAGEDKLVYITYEMDYDNKNYCFTGSAVATASIYQAVADVYLYYQDKVFDGTTECFYTYYIDILGLDYSSQISLSATAPVFSDASAGTNKTVIFDESTISFLGEIGQNYQLGDVIYSNKTPTISKAYISIVVVDAEDKVYDGTTTAEVNVELVPIDSSLDTFYYVVDGIFAQSDVGDDIKVSYVYTGSDGYLLENFIIVTIEYNTSMTASITPLDVAITFIAADKVYDGSVIGEVYFEHDSQYDFFDGVTISGMYAVFDTANAMDDISVEFIGDAVFSNILSTNFVFTYSYVDTASIAKKDLVIVDYENIDRTYNATLAVDNTYSVSGIVGNEDVNVTITANLGQLGVGNMAVNVTIVVSGDDIGNYNKATLQQSYVYIAKSTVYLTVDLQDKVYDGTTAGKVLYSLDGLYECDEDYVYVAGTTTATFESKNVGYNLATFDVSNIYLTGDSSDYYQISVVNTSGYANITALDLVVTVAVEEKQYDGTTAGTVLYSYDNLVEGDDIYVSGVVATFRSANAGTNNVSFTGSLQAGGSDILNYNISDYLYESSGVIVAKEVYLEGLVVSDKTYDGTTDAQVSDAGNLVGVLDVDSNLVAFDVEVSFVNGSVLSSNNLVTVTVTLSGTQKGNYFIDDDSIKAYANITAKAVEVYLSASKVYDGTTVAYLGLDSLVGILEQDFDAVTVSLADKYGDYASKNVGENITVTFLGELDLEGTLSSNYYISTISSSFTGSISAMLADIVISVQDKQYDSTNVAVVDSIVDNAISNDDISVYGVVAYFSGVDAASVSTNSTIDITQIYLSGADMLNYTISSVSYEHGKITAAVINVLDTIVSDKAYDATYNATVSQAGTALGVGGEIVDFTIASATFSENTVGDDIEVLVKYSVTDNDNYVIDDSVLYASISALGITLSLYAEDKTYDATTVATYTYEGFLEVDTVAVSGVTANFATKNVGDNIAVAFDYSALSIANANYYIEAVEIVGGTASIALAELVVDVSTSNRVYDGTVYGNVQYDYELLLQDELTISGGIADFGSSRVGTYSTIDYDLSTAVISGSDKDNYYISYVLSDSQVIISKLAVELDIEYTSEKVYDGTTDAYDQITSIIITNLIDGDTVNVSYQAKYSSANVGSGSITVTSTLSGSDASNYYVAGTTAKDATIVHRSIEIVFYMATDKTYNGTTTANISYSFVNNISSDSITVSNVTAAFDTASIGEDKTVTISGTPTLTGDDASNYVISTYNSVALGNIVPKTITIDISVDDKVYDGTTDATYTIDSSSVIEGDDVVVVYNGTVTFEQKNASEDCVLAVFVGEFVYSGDQVSNYSFVVNYNNEAYITAKQVTLYDYVVADKVYDKSATGTLSEMGTILGVIDGDDVTHTATNITYGGTSAGQWESTIDISLQGSDSGNYYFDELVVNATIVQKDLFVDITASDKAYDATTAIEFEYEVTGSLDGQLTISGISIDTSSANVGVYNIQLAGTVVVEGSYAGNYNVIISSVTSQVEITARNISISYYGDNKIYDGSDSLDVVYTILGSATAELDAAYSLLEIGGITAISATANVGTHDVTYSGEATISGEGYQNFVISSTSASSDTAKISQKLLTIDDLSIADKVYDGYANAEVDNAGSLVGVVDYDNVELQIIMAYYLSVDASASRAGIVVVQLAGDESANYYLSTYNISVVGTISKADATITLTFNDKEYDATTSVVICSAYATLLDEDSSYRTKTPSGLTYVFADANVGEDIQIIISGSAVYSTTINNNYNFTIEASYASISKKTINYSFVGYTKEYGDENSDITIEYEFVSAEQSNYQVDVAPTYVCSVTQLSVVGEYSISLAANGEDRNYTLVYDDSKEGSVTVEQRQITASYIYSVTKTYDGTTTVDAASTMQAYGFRLDGIVNGDTTVTVYSSTAYYSDKNVGENKTITVSNLELYGDMSENYCLTSTTVQFSLGIITAKELSDITDILAVYNQDTQDYSIYSFGSFVGVVDGDEVYIAKTQSSNNLAVGYNGNDISYISFSNITMLGDDSGNYVYTGSSVVVLEEIIFKYSADIEYIANYDIDFIIYFEDGMDVRVYRYNIPDNWYFQLCTGDEEPVDTSTPVEVVVEFVIDDVVVSRQTFDYGYLMTCSDMYSYSDKYGYEFVGWYDATGSSVYGDDYFYPLFGTEVVTFTGNFVASEYEINYYLDGGTNASSNPATYSMENADFNLEDATKAGYTFAGWFDSDGNQITFIYSGKTGDIDLYAQWVEVSAYYTEGLEYTLVNDGTAYEVSALGTATDTDIVVPSTYNGLPVIGIGQYAFYCGSYGSGFNTYMSAPLITTTLEQYIDSIVLPDSITYISEYAFSGNRTLLTISFGEGLVSIGNYAFDSCTSLSQIDIPEGFTSIGSYAFYECTSMTTITIPSTLADIAQYAFAKCTALTSVVIPEGVLYIGSNAFAGCSKLTYIAISSTVSNIDSSAFINSTALLEISVAEDSLYYTSVDGNLYSNDMTTLVHYLASNTDSSFTVLQDVNYISSYAFYGCSNLVSIVLSDSIISIGEYAFYGCSNLVSITLPNSIISIGEYAFYGCKNLVSVVLPDNITSIGSYTFYGCSNLVSVVIPYSITSINVYAFYGCTSLVSITIPEGVASIGSYAFTNCTSLETIYYNATNVLYLALFGADGIFSNVGSATNGCLVVIGDNVVSMPHDMFYDCTNITSIIIGNSVGTIESSAFYGCSGLTSVVIPESVTNMGSYVFKNCSNLVIFCEASSQPSGWDSTWNNSNLVVYWAGEWSYVDGVPTAGGSSQEYDGDLYDLYANNVEAIQEHVGYETSFVYASQLEDFFGEDYLSADFFGYVDPSIILSMIVNNVDMDSADCDIYAIELTDDYTDEAYDLLVNSFGCVQVDNIFIFVDLLPKEILYGEPYDDSSSGSGDQTITYTLEELYWTNEVYIFDFLVQAVGYGGVQFLFIEDVAFVYGDDAALELENLFYDYVISVIYVDGMIVALELAGYEDAMLETLIDEWAFSQYGMLFVNEQILPYDVLAAAQIYGGGSDSYYTDGDFEYYVNDTNYVLTAYHGSDAIVVVPDYITAIGECAFSGKTSLVSVVLPEGLTEIYGCAFEMCGGLSSIILPSTLTYIGDLAFYYTSLSLVVIPANTSYVAYSAFMSWDVELDICIEGDESRTYEWNEWYSEEGDNTVNVYYEGQYDLVTVTFDMGYDSFDVQVMSGSTVRQPSAIVIEGYGIVGWYTDTSCTQLYEFSSAAEDGLVLYAKWTGGDYVALYDMYQFQLSEVDGQVVCTITDVVYWQTDYYIPDCVTAIADYAFSYLSGIRVYIGTNVTYVGEYAFYCCWNSSVYYYGSQEDTANWGANWDVYYSYEYVYLSNDDTSMTTLELIEMFGDSYVGGIFVYDGEPIAIELTSDVSDEMAMFLVDEAGWDRFGNIFINQEMLLYAELTGQDADNIVVSSSSLSELSANVVGQFDIHISVYYGGDWQYYNLTFVGLGGETIAEYSVIEGSWVVMYYFEPYASGYIFDGWYLDEALTEQYFYDESITENLVLYTSFVVNPYGYLDGWYEYYIEGDDLYIYSAFAYNLYTGEYIAEDGYVLVPECEYLAGAFWETGYSYGIANYVLPANIGYVDGYAFVNGANIFCLFEESATSYWYPEWCEDGCTVYYLGEWEYVDGIPTATVYKDPVNNTGGSGSQSTSYTLEELYASNEMYIVDYLSQAGYGDIAILTVEEIEYYYGAEAIEELESIFEDAVVHVLYADGEIVAIELSYYTDYMYSVLLNVWGFEQHSMVFNNANVLPYYMLAYTQVYSSGTYSITVTLNSGDYQFSSGGNISTFITSAGNTIDCSSYFYAIDVADGYVFAGWSLTEGGEVAGYIYADINIQLYAVYVEAFTITIDLDGGYVDNSQYELNDFYYIDGYLIYACAEGSTVSSDVIWTLLSSVYKDGYLIDNFIYYDANGDAYAPSQFGDYYNGMYLDFVIDQDIVLVAQWSTAVNVVFHNDGATMNGINGYTTDWYTGTMTTSQYANQYYSLPTANTLLTMDGVYAIGWSLTPNGDIIEYILLGEEEVHLYPVWAETATVVVYFGDNVNSEQYEWVDNDYSNFDYCGDYAVLYTYVGANLSNMDAYMWMSGYAWHYDGLKYVGYSTEPNGSVISSSSYIIEGDTVLYMVWVDANTTYNVTVNTFGGYYTSDAQLYLQDTFGSQVVSADSTEFILATEYKLYLYMLTGSDVAPTMDGYTFMGLSYQQGGEIIQTYSYITITSDVTLYAVWAQTVIVSYSMGELDLINDYNNHFDDDNISTEYSTVGAEVDLETMSWLLPHYCWKYNYYFVGWSLTEGGEILDELILEDDVMLYAVWLEGVAITIDINGGTLDSSSLTYYTSWYPVGDTQLVGYFEPDSYWEYNISLYNSLDNLAAYAGYYFVGFSLEPDGELIENDSLMLGQSDVTLYAIWAPYVTVTIYANGGTINDTMSNMTIVDNTFVGECYPYDVWHCESYTNSFSNCATCTGFYFVGFSYSKSGDIITNPFIILGEEDVVLYAIWEVAPVIRVDANGGTIYDGYNTGGYLVMLGSDSTVQLLEWYVTNNIHREGYACSYFSYDAEGNLPIETYVFSEDAILYVQWEEIVYPVLQLDANGGTVMSDTWGCYTAYDAGYVATLDSSYVWLSTYTSDMTSSYMYRAGYTLVGWSYTPYGNAIEDRTIYITEDTTLYAVWTPTDTIVITLASNPDMCSGSGYMNTDIVIEGASYTYNYTNTEIYFTASKGVWYDVLLSFELYTLLWEMYTFAGYSTNQYSTVAEDFSNFEFTEDITLYAVWQKVDNTGFMISLNANGGTITVDTWGEYEVVDNSLVGYVDESNILWLGDTTITLANCDFFYFEGYAIVGWSYTVGGNIITDFTIDLTQDTTLYAVWAEVITVTINANGGEFTNIDDFIDICNEQINVLSYTISDDLTQMTVSVAAGDATWLTYINPYQEGFNCIGYSVDSTAVGSDALPDIVVGCLLYALWIED